MASAEREPITGVWGQGAKGVRGRSPPEAEGFSDLRVPQTSKRGSKSAQFLRFWNLSWHNALGDNLGKEIATKIDFSQRHKFPWYYCDKYSVK